MKDPKKALREAYYQALNGQLSYDGSEVSVWDKKAEDITNNVYVIIGEDTSVGQNTFSSFDTETTIVIDIVSKQHDRVSSHVLNEVAAQILAIILPTPSTTGLTDTDDFQFLNVRIESDNDGPVSMSGTRFLVRRLIRFSQHIHQL